jgi:hypothetical protein
VALGGGRALLSHKPRWLRITLITFIFPEHFGQVSGSTSLISVVPDHLFPFVRNMGAHGP